jgi:dihydropteroate synthase
MCSLIGIVNITEDSFSDGGRYLSPRAAVAHARRLRADGADVVELGPAASHPDSAPVTVAEERRRLAPVLEQLAADGIPVSVDSPRPETMRFAISGGAAFLNARRRGRPRRAHRPRRCHIRRCHIRRCHIRRCHIRRCHIRRARSVIPATGKTEAEVS